MYYWECEKKSRYILFLLIDILLLFSALIISPFWYVFVTLVETLDYTQEVKRRRIGKAVV